MGATAMDMDERQNGDGRDREPTLRAFRTEGGGHPRIRTEAMTHRGKVRELNEDQFLVAEVGRSLDVLHTSLATPTTCLRSDPAVMFAVADGVGSVRGGEVASAMALDAIVEYALAALPVNEITEGSEVRLAQGLDVSLTGCQGRMVSAAECKGLDPRMATTLTVAYLAWPDLLVAHLGDSRAYLLRGSRLIQITHDQTVAQELVDKGVMHPAQMSGNPLAHTLTSFVGGEGRSVEIQAHRVLLEAGDLVLLCTDGLHGQVDDARIAERLGAVREGGCLQQCTNALVDDANLAGGRDNVTVVAAHCTGRPEGRDPS